MSLSALTIFLIVLSIITVVGIIYFATKKSADGSPGNWSEDDKKYFLSTTAKQEVDNLNQKCGNSGTSVMNCVVEKVSSKYPISKFNDPKYVPTNEEMMDALSIYSECMTQNCNPSTPPSDTKKPFSPPPPGDQPPRDQPPRDQPPRDQPPRDQPPLTDNDCFDSDEKCEAMWKRAISPPYIDGGMSSSVGKYSYPTDPPPRWGIGPGDLIKCSKYIFGNKASPKPDAARSEILCDAILSDYSAGSSDPQCGGQYQNVYDNFGCGGKGDINGPPAPTHNVNCSDQSNQQYYDDAFNKRNDAGYYRNSVDGFHACRDDCGNLPGLPPCQNLCDVSCRKIMSPTHV
jgi:hypothetical protein